MTPYDIGLRAAQQVNVPGHLKEAYAQGFADTFEKKAAPPIRSPEDIKALLAFMGLGVPVGAGIGSLLHGVSEAVRHPDGETSDVRKKRIRGGFIRGAGRGAIGLPAIMLGGSLLSTFAKR